MPNRLRYIPVAALIFALTGAKALAEICPGSDVKKAKLQQFDSHLVLSQSEISAALARHLPFGAPECGKILALKEYIVCYDAGRRIPRWVGYALTAADVVTKERRDAFRTDPRLTDDESSHCADYKFSGFDRGHAVPRGDMNRTFEVQAYTFLLSNMLPQTPALNRGMWRWLEEATRAWAKKFGQVYIFAGPVFIGPNTNTLPSGRVVIPLEFFKIVIREDANGDLQVESFLLVNGTNLPIPPGTQGVAGPRITATQADTFLVQHSTSIDAIEFLTGLNFLSDLSAAKQNAVESATGTSLWPR